MVDDEGVKQDEQGKADVAKKVIARSYKEMVLGVAGEDTNEESMEGSEWESKDEKGEGDNVEVTRVEEKRIHKP